MTKHESAVQEFEKEKVRLPDGRELVYYRFPEPAPRAAPAPVPAAPSKAQEG